MSGGLTATVIVVSDSVSSGASEDRSGELLCEGLDNHDVRCLPIVIVPDDVAAIQLAVQAATTDIVALTGGTGVSPRDVTPEAVEPLIEKRLPGVEEAIRSFGLRQNPKAMLSRTLVGTKGATLILCLPGSPSGVADALEAAFPTVLHVFEVFEGRRH